MSFTLDPDRREQAAHRAREALAEASYHEQRAKAERALADSLARTWGLRIHPSSKVEVPVTDVTHSPPQS